MRRARRRTGGPPQDTGGLPQEAGLPPQEAGEPLRDTGGLPQEAGGPPQEAGGTPPGAGRPPQGAEDSIAERAAELATEVTEAEQPEERRRLTAAFAAAARASARATGRGVRAARRGAGTGMGWLTEQVVAMAPRVRVRNTVALRAQFPGKSTEEIADALIVGASRASGAVGGAVGAWAALPVLPAFPVELVTETLALIGIELKLIAELHEVYGMVPPGTTMDRATAYIGAWAHRRGVLAAPGALILVAGSPLGRRLRLRLAARAGRSAFSLGPLFTGAAAGAMLNSRETRRLGLDVRADLRRRAGGRGAEVARGGMAPELET
jgi:hypothetical protein